MQASYGATVEGKILASFRAARRAYDAHETVLELDPSRKDAGLDRRHVSLHRVGAVAAGAPDGVRRGVRRRQRARACSMIEEAAAYPG